MLENLISLIFRPEIPHDELIKVLYLFCSELLLFSTKIAEIVHETNRKKMVDISAWSITTITSLLKSAKASSLFLFLCSNIATLDSIKHFKLPSFFSVISELNKEFPAISLSDGRAVPYMTLYKQLQVVYITFWRPSD